MNIYFMWQRNTFFCYFKTFHLVVSAGLSTYHLQILHWQRRFCLVWYGMVWYSIVTHLNTHLNRHEKHQKGLVRSSLKDMQLIVRNIPETNKLVAPKITNFMPYQLFWFGFNKTWGETSICPCLSSLKNWICYWHGIIHF